MGLVSESCSRDSVSKKQTLVVYLWWYKCCGWAVDKGDFEMISYKEDGIHSDKLRKRGE